MQRFTRSQSKLGPAASIPAPDNRPYSANNALHAPDQGIQGTSNAPQVSRRRQRENSDDVAVLKSAPCSKKAKLDVHSSEPQFQGAVENGPVQQDAPVTRKIDLTQAMRSHDIATLRKFLQSTQSTPRVKVQLLHETAQGGWLEGFDTMVEHGALTESCQTDLALSKIGQHTLFERVFFSQNSLMLDRLNALECPMHQRSRSEIKNAMVIASYTSHPEMLQRLCWAADVGKVRWSSAEMSSFFKAAVVGTKIKSGSFVRGAAVIEYLLGKYPDSAVRSTFDEALLTAVKLNNWEAAARLLGEHGANPDARNLKEQTALMNAATNGQFDIYELLRFHEASPHAQDADGKSVLHHAVDGGNERIVSDLVGNCKVDTKVRNHMQQTALAHAGMLGRDAIADMIIWGVSPSFDSTDF